MAPHYTRPEQKARDPQRGTPGQLVFNRHGNDFRMRNTDPAAWSHWAKSNGPVIVRNAGSVQIGNIPYEIPGIQIENATSAEIHGANCNLNGTYTFKNIKILNIKGVNFGENATFVFENVDFVTFNTVKISTKGTLDFNGISDLYMEYVSIYATPTIKANSKGKIELFCCPCSDKFMKALEQSSKIPANHWDYSMSRYLYTGR